MIRCIEWFLQEEAGVKGTKQNIPYPRLGANPSTEGILVFDDERGGMFDTLQFKGMEDLDKLSVVIPLVIFRKTYSSEASKPLLSHPRLSDVIARPILQSNDQIRALKLVELVLLPFRRGRLSFLDIDPSRILIA